MGSLNKVLLIGRLGKDPEVRYLDQGRIVTSFSLATDESYKNKAGERVSQTEWHNCQSWGKLAEVIQKYVKKGALIYVEGKLKTQSWDDKDGKKQYRTIVEVTTLQMLERVDKKDAESSHQDVDDFFPSESMPPSDLPF